MKVRCPVLDRYTAIGSWAGTLRQPARSTMLRAAWRCTPDWVVSQAKMISCSWSPFSSGGAIDLYVADTIPVAGFAGGEAPLALVEEDKVCLDECLSRLAARPVVQALVAEHSGLAPLRSSEARVSPKQYPVKECLREAVTMHRRRLSVEEVHHFFRDHVATVVGDLLIIVEGIEDDAEGVVFVA